MAITIKEHQQRLKKVVNAMEDKEKLVALAFSVHSVLMEAYLKRIFVNGIATNGSKIGTYSTKEIWAKVPFYPSQLSQSNLEKLGKPKKKKGDLEKIAYPTEQTMYIVDGYEGLRKILGLKNDTVILNLTGSLFSSVKLVQEQDILKIVIIGKDSVDKSEGMELKYKKDIFALSEEEKEAFIKAITLAYTDYLKRIYYGS